MKKCQRSILSPALVTAFFALLLFLPGLIHAGDSELRASPNSSMKTYTGVQNIPGQVLLDDDWNENNFNSGLFCSIYRGVVTNNTDPSSLMRLQVQVPAVLGNQMVWALPCIPIGTSVVLPAIGKGVWIMFEGGNPNSPVWMGTWNGTK
jgi:type VI secretion system (T6SS) baseplate-like injector VgrG